MSILYFHLHDGVDRLLDEDGSDISLADAPARALKEARAIIADEALNGRIDLTSEVGLGSTFVVTVASMKQVSDQNA